MVFGTWDLNFGAWEILGYGFQDMVFKTWDLNFGAWIFTLAVSKIETWKLLGRDFQDVRSQFWDLDFTQGLHSGLWPRPPTSHSWIPNTQMQQRFLIGNYVQLLKKWNFKPWPCNNPIFYLLLSCGYLEFFLQNGYGMQLLGILRTKWLWREMTINFTTWI